jgi:hypothetical protein
MLGTVQFQPGGPALFPGLRPKGRHRLGPRLNLAEEGDALPRRLCHAGYVDWPRIADDHRERLSEHDLIAGDLLRLASFWAGDREGGE